MQEDRRPNVGGYMPEGDSAGAAEEGGKDHTEAGGLRAKALRQRKGAAAPEPEVQPKDEPPAET